MDEKLQKGEFVEAMLRSHKTIFTLKDVALLWGERVENAVRVRLNNYVKRGKLLRLRRGIYAKDQNYDRLEMATRIYTPSYISFETILTRGGVNFQYYETIFVASYLSREVEVAGQKINFVRIKDDVLSNIMGIDSSGSCSMATVERAFLDRIYVSKDYHFDNLDILNWEKVFEILPIYNSKRMNIKIKEYHKEYGIRKA